MTTRIIDSGAKVKAYLEELSKKIETAKVLNVGFLEGSTEISGEKVVSVPMIAAIQQFGAPAVGIPPRPFMTNFVRDYSDEWGPALGDLLVKHNFDSTAALTELGSGMAPQLQESISDLYEPALSPVTLMLRMMRSQGGADFVMSGAKVAEARKRVADGEVATGVSAKPLIDSGQMQQAVDFEVKT